MIEMTSATQLQVATSELTSRNNPHRPEGLGQLKQVTNSQLQPDYFQLLDDPVRLKIAGYLGADDYNNFRASCREFCRLLISVNEMKQALTEGLCSKITRQKYINHLVNNYYQRYCREVTPEIKQAISSTVFTLSDQYQIRAIYDYSYDCRSGDPAEGLVIYLKQFYNKDDFSAMNITHPHPDRIASAEIIRVKRRDICFFGLNPQEMDAQLASANKLLQQHTEVAKWLVVYQMVKLVNDGSGNPLSGLAADYAQQAAEKYPLLFGVGNQLLKHREV